MGKRHHYGILGLARGAGPFSLDPMPSSFSFCIREGAPGAWKDGELGAKANDLSMHTLSMSVSRLPQRSINFSP